MKSLSCKDLAGSSSTSCNFTATGENADGVKNKMFAHAQEAHADVLASMSEQDMKDVQGKMDSLLA